MRVCEHSERSERQGDVEAKDEVERSESDTAPSIFLLRLDWVFGRAFFIFPQLLFISFFNLLAFFIGVRPYCCFGINFFLISYLIFPSICSLLSYFFFFLLFLTPSLFSLLSSFFSLISYLISPSLFSLVSYFLFLISKVF